MHFDNPGIPTIPSYQPGTPIAAYIAGLVALILVTAIVALGPKLLTRRQDNKPPESDPKPDAAETTGMVEKVDRYDALVDDTITDLRMRLDQANKALAAAEEEVRRAEQDKTQALMQLQEARWHLEQARGEVTALRAQLAAREQRPW